MSAASTAIVAAAAEASLSPFPMKIENFDALALRARDIEAYQPPTPGKYIAFSSAARGLAPVIQIGQLVPAKAEDPEFTAESSVWLGFPCIKPGTTQSGALDASPSSKMNMPMEFSDDATLTGVQMLRAFAAETVWEQRAKIDASGDATVKAEATLVASGDDKSAANIYKHNIGAWIAPLTIPRVYKEKTYFELTAKVQGWGGLLGATRWGKGAQSGKPYVLEQSFNARTWQLGLFSPEFKQDDCVFEMLVGWKDGVAQTVKRVPSGGVWRALGPDDVPRRAPLEVYIKQPKIHFAGAHGGSIQLTAVRVIFAPTARTYVKPQRELGAAATLDDDATEALFTNGAFKGFAPLPAPAAPQLALENGGAAQGALFSPASQAIPSLPPPLPLRRARPAFEDNDDEISEAVAAAEASFIAKKARL